jgi:tetratricopeptide (TPR) repeat protein
MGSSSRISYPLVWGIVFATIASLLLGWIVIARTQVATTSHTPTELNLQGWQALARENPQDSGAQLQLGFAYYRMAKEEKDAAKRKDLLLKALANYEASLKLNSKVITTQYNRALVLRDLGRTDEALAAFEKLITLNQGDTWATHDAAVIYFERGNLKKAIKLFEQATKAEPQASNYRLDLAKAYVKAGRKRDAITQLTYALRMDPSNTESKSLLASLTADTKKKTGGK